MVFSPLKPRKVGAKRTRGSKSCCCYSALLDEREQVGIDLVGVRCRHSMRKTRIHLQRGILHELCGLRGRCADGHDLIIVTMKNESGNVEPLEIFREVRFGEGLDAVVMRLDPSHHSLQPPMFTDAFGSFGAREAVAIKRKGNVLVKLSPVLRKVCAESVENRDGCA